MKSKFLEKKNLYPIIATLVLSAMLISTPFLVDNKKEDNVEIPNTLSIDEDSITLKGNEKVSEVKKVAYKKIIEVKNKITT
jgi:hypothetical protein